MVRYYTSLFFVLFIVKLSFGQELTCPSNIEVACYEQDYGEPIYNIDEAYKLQKSLEYFTTLCDTSLIKIQYNLLDTINFESVSSCEQLVKILPFDEPINFPADTIYYDMHLSEVPSQGIYNEVNFPEITDACRLNITYEDLPIEFYPRLILFRHWVVTNLCTEEISEAMQRIEMRDLPNNSIQIPFTDCTNSEVLVDSFDLLLNGNKLNYLNCFEPFDGLQNLVNCVAESNSMNSNDTLEIVLHYDYDPIDKLSLEDIIAVMRHIIGFEKIEDPCKLNAADANRDGEVNGFDLVELRKYILGVYGEWPYPSPAVYYLNGQEKTQISFGGNDFPLSELKIEFPYTGSVYSN